ncbi:TolC family protein [Proluteimonas luteida]|uniref:TolC family protein n=1 Tax=Proluteimonas luteida TaxID=2878685 RepID=UPI003F4A1834
MQPGAPPPQQGTAVPLSYAQAEQHLFERSDALMAADANVRGLAAEHAATRRLRVPDVSAEIRRMRFQKTVELPLGSLAPVAEVFGIPSPLTFEFDDWRTRPLLTATMPLYTGGLIPAAQGAAEAAVGQADAERLLQQQTLAVQLVHAYYGQQLAEQALAIRTAVRDGLQRHLDDALRLEQEGFASRAQRLQATVARDKAEREYRKARNDLDSTRATLALLLHAGGDVQPVSPLFVHAAPVGTLEAFIDAAEASHPQVRRLQSMVAQAGHGVRAQQAQYKPTIYAFGQYDFRRQDAFLDDPDWAFGIGLKYTFLSGQGRSQKLSAARAKHDEAEAGLREARNQLRIGVTQAWNALETARVQYQLLDSSIAEAAENLRLQELSFREGMATSLDVIDARLTLGGAQVERAEAAYAYDVALAELLQMSGQTARFDALSRTATAQVVAP